MAISPVGQSTVSTDIQQLAAQLLANERQPIQTLQTRRQALSSRSSALGTLRTRLSDLQSALTSLKGIGTLSPFATKLASSSDATVLNATASATAAPATLSVAVSQLARRATHVSNLFTDTGTTISDAGTGTFGFTVTIGGTGYTGSVTVNAGDSDQTVLDAVAQAVTTATGGKASAARMQTETGRSRLSLSSITTGTTNKLVFTDTDGLLTRLGVVHASPTAATDTTGGYIFDDLGGHELDAKLVVDGLTYYRESNTVSDLVSGTTFSLKGTSTSAATVKIQPDADNAIATLKNFIDKYNNVLDYLGQQTAIDAKAGTQGALALDPVFGSLGSQLRLQMAARVTSQPAGTPDALSTLGLAIGSDGKLSIKSESDLKDTFTKNPDAVASLFNATDGIATRLATFVGGYSSVTGQIAASQNALRTRMSGLDSQIQSAQDRLAKKQAQLEQQLAKQQALVQQLAKQQAQIQAFMGAVQ